MSDGLELHDAMNSWALALEERSQALKQRESDLQIVHVAVKRAIRVGIPLILANIALFAANLALWR